MDRQSRHGIRKTPGAVYEQRKKLFQRNKDTIDWLVWEPPEGIFIRQGPEYPYSRLRSFSRVCVSVKSNCKGVSVAQPSVSRPLSEPGVTVSGGMVPSSHQ